MNFLLLAILILVFLMGVPIAIVIALTTLILIHFTTNIPLIALPQQMFAGIDTTLLLAVYFFILLQQAGCQPEFLNLFFPQRQVVD